MKQAALDEWILNIEQTLEIKAAPGDVYEGLLANLCELPGEDGKPPVKLTLERWPGGRYFRDLEGGQGHLWAHVQSIKPPTLIELYGPMFMSHPVAGHLMARLTPIPGGTKLVFKHDVFGPFPAEMREGTNEGWAQVLAKLKREVER